jgi:hypothetical protein
MIRPMGIAVAFTNAETKGRLRQRFSITGEAGSVKTGREGTRLARFPQAKTATGKMGKPKYRFGRFPIQLSAFCWSGRRRFLAGESRLRGK